MDAETVIMNSLEVDVILPTPIASQDVIMDSLNVDIILETEGG